MRTEGLDTDRHRSVAVDVLVREEQEEEEEEDDGKKEDDEGEQDDEGYSE